MKILDVKVTIDAEAQNATIIFPSGVALTIFADTSAVFTAPDGDSVVLTAEDFAVLPVLEEALQQIL